MVDNWWIRLRGMRLRRAVLMLLCVSIISAFAADVNFHAAHAYHEHGAISASVNETAASDCHAVTVIAAERSHDGNTPDHSQCDHSHCCISFVLPILLQGSAPVMRTRHPHPVDDQPTASPQLSFDRPPIAHL
jgi:hypothetical protein